MNFPKHFYFGPGNELNRGKPVDRDDEIAEQHDLDYFNSRSFNDIIVADKRAINNFYDDWCKTKNWHSLVGHVCLQTKTFIEKKIGRSLYPWNMPKDK